MRGDLAGPGPLVGQLLEFVEQPVQGEGEGKITPDGDVAGEKGPDPRVGPGEYRAEDLGAPAHGGGGRRRWGAAPAKEPAVVQLDSRGLAAIGAERHDGLAAGQQRARRRAAQPRGERACQVGPETSGALRVHAKLAGRSWAQGATCSSCAARASSSASRPRRATSCTASGKPAGVRPAGRDSAG